MSVLRSFSFWVVLISFVVALFGAINSDRDLSIRVIGLLGIPFFVYELIKFFQGREVVYFGVVARSDDKAYRFGGFLVYLVLLFIFILMLFN